MVSLCIARIFYEFSKSCARIQRVMKLAHASLKQYLSVIFRYFFSCDIIAVGDVYSILYVCMDKQRGPCGEGMG